MEKLPAQMTVIGISKPGGPEVLVPETRPVPAPGPNEILIKVTVAGVNRPDVAQRSGSYPPPPGASDLPGLEVAGEVVALGAGASKYKLGDKVMSLVSGGGYAQYCTAHEKIAMHIPAGLSMSEAGATPETLMTVWHNVFERGALKAGETLLIHGGSSGIGTMAIQLAKAFGAKIIVTVGSQDKADACVRLGADHAINYKTQDFVAEVKALTGGTGANLILDMVGGDYIEKTTMPPRSRAASFRSPSGRPQGDRQFRQGHGQAAASYRIDAAAAFGRRQGRDGQRHRGQSTSLDARRTNQTADRQQLSARTGRGRTSADGSQRAYWQNCVDGLGPGELVLANLLKPVISFAIMSFISRRVRRRQAKASREFAFIL